MSDSPDQSKSVVTEPVPTRSRWRFGQTGWILIAGLVLLNIGVVIETVDWNRCTVNWLLFRLDPRYWSLLPVPVLWGIVCWLATDFVCRFDFIRIRQKRQQIRFIIVLGTLCALALLGGLAGITVQRWLHYNVYMEYIVGPIADYFATGTWNWRMLITPVIAVVTIAFLLYIAVKYRKPKS
ncbi:hypothetical protein FACS1894189_6650 [Planctomycetales bacterium]|nr:hypothetical protein FACS1894189_6650 [Planctomycetales bacterium]